MKILVLEASGLNLGFLGCYGNDWIGTPNLDRLAAEGIVFDAHFLDCPHPQFDARRAAWTGRHGRDASTATLAEQLTRAGKSWHAARCEKLANFAHAAAKAWDALTGAGVCWIEGPVLAPPWHLPADMLAAYCDEGEDPLPDPPRGEAPRDFDERRCQDTYAAVVTYYDEQVGRIFERVQAADDALIVVTACAGLPLGERGLVGFEGLSLHEESLHVPMLWRLPGGAEAGLRVSALTQPADVPGSLLEAMGVRAEPAHGVSVWPAIRGETAAVRPYALANQGADWLIRTPEWAYFHTAAELGRLYVKPEDRWEVNDVGQQHPALFERFEKVLPRLVEALQQPGPFVSPSLEAVEQQP